MSGLMRVVGFVREGVGVKSQFKRPLKIAASGTCESCLIGVAISLGFQEDWFKSKGQNKQVLVRCWALREGFSSTADHRILPELLRMNLRITANS